MVSQELRRDVFNAEGVQDRPLSDQHITIALLADELPHNRERDCVGAMHGREAVVEEDGNEDIERA